MKRTWSLSWPKKAKAEPTTSVDESTENIKDSSTTSETAKSDQVEQPLKLVHTNQDQGQLVPASEITRNDNSELSAGQESPKDDAKVPTTTAQDLQGNKSEVTASNAKGETTSKPAESEKSDFTPSTDDQTTTTETSPESKPKQLPIKKLKEYPISDRKLSLPESTKEGQIQVAAGRGKPFWLSYKAYGTGPIYIVWLCGHGDTIKAWRRLVTHFGHESSDKYTSLLVDSRGTGDSEGPFGWWSMKDMAADVVELLNKLEWTEDKSVHLVGHSMGGMMAQEIALSTPQRIASLTLIATTSDWLSDLSVWSGTKTLFTMLTPKSEDQRLADTKTQFFGSSWILEPDETGVFPTNGDNWAATSYLEADISYRGAALQGPACIRHSVKPEDLKSVAEKIGQSNIQIIHGHSDKICPFAAAQRLYDIFGGHQNSGVQLHVFEDTGHMPQIERYPQVVKLIEGITKSVATS